MYIEVVDQIKISTYMFNNSSISEKEYKTMNLGVKFYTTNFDPKFYPTSCNKKTYFFYI